MSETLFDREADDLTQETFLRVWTRSEQWDGRGSFTGWLYRIATNLALNHLRSVKRRRQRPLELPAEPDDDDDDWVPSDGYCVGKAGWSGHPRPAISPFITEQKNRRKQSAAMNPPIPIPGICSSA